MLLHAIMQFWRDFLLHVVAVPYADDSLKLNLSLK